MNSLNDRFDFDDDAIAPGDEAILQGTLWRVYDNASGSAERRLRTWKKTGGDIDDELRSLWRHEMRQVRRLMRYRDASDLIVDVLEGYCQVVCCGLEGGASRLSGCHFFGI
ncbi:hypothetical protein C0081_16725, partial [Cohaesibacter celericrescens]